MKQKKFKNSEDNVRTIYNRKPCEKCGVLKPKNEKCGKCAEGFE